MGLAGFISQARGDRQVTQVTPGPKRSTVRRYCWLFDLSIRPRRPAQNRKTSVGITEPYHGWKTKRTPTRKSSACVWRFEL